MTAPRPRHSEPTAAARRTRYALTTAVLVLAVTAACVLASYAASLRPVRFDVTATREHTLSPRTLNTLASLDEPCEIVVVADLPRLDRRAVERMRDVLDAFARSSPRLAITEIDTFSPSGRAQFTALADRLAAASQGAIDTHTAAIEASLAAVGRVETALPTLSDALLALNTSLGSAAPESAAITQIAAAARVLARQSADAAARAQAALAQRLAGSSMPAVDEAANLLRTLTKARAADLGSLADATTAVVTSLSGRSADSALIERARAAQASLASLRDDASRAHDALDRLAPIDAIAAVRDLERASGAMVITPRGARAVPLGALFPPPDIMAAAAGATADLRFVGEELLAAAIATLADEAQPIVVFVHAAPQKQLDPRGRAATPDAETLLGSLLESLRMRGVSVLEWAPAAGEARPSLNALDPSGARPVVWIVIGVSVTTPEGAGAMNRLAGALAGLVDSGENVLVSIDASTLPSVGEPDPMALPLEPLGVRVRSGLRLMQRLSRPAGAVIDGAITLLRGADGDFALARALDGQAVLLNWPSPIELTPVPGVAAWPVLTLGAPDAWAESEWLAWLSLSEPQRAALRDVPRPDPARDDADGPWTLAAAIERASPADAGRTQRLVVVGASGWFFDPFTRRAELIEGRTVLKNPGNRELFDASVSFLAHQDDRIAPGVSARATPRIADAPPALLLALRWSIILGLPALVLLLGAAWRLLRG